jgi:ABC-2 type transport system ATP-binding protein
MFLSSHQLEDVEMVCHRVSIIHKGKLRILGFVDELLAGELVEISVSGASARFGERVKMVVPGASVVGGTGTIIARDEPGLVAQVLDLAREENTRITSIIPTRRTLEDLFVEIVGERISSEGGTNMHLENGMPTSPDAAAIEGRKKPVANKYKELSQK